MIIICELTLNLLHSLRPGKCTTLYFPQYLLISCNGKADDPEGKPV